MEDMISGIDLLLATRGFSMVLEGLGLDLKDPNLQETPARVVAALYGFCRGSVNTQEEIDGILSKKFPSEYDEMIVIRGIETTGICPHHFLPIIYESVVAYTPASDGYVVGLSKIPRLVSLLSARPVLQEQLVVDISTAIQLSLLPAGVGVMMLGKHGCMSCRGVTMRNSDTVTTKLLGSIKEDPKARAEFLANCQKLLNKAV